MPNPTPIFKFRLLKRLPVLTAVSLLAPFLIFLLGPFSIYQGNQEEFTSPLTAILARYVMPAAALFLLTVFLGLLAPQRVYRLYLAVIVAIGVAIWVQGHLLVWNFGVLDGTSIAWSEYKSHAVADWAVWGGLLAIATIAARQVARHAVFISLGLIAVQIVYIAALELPAPGVLRAGDEHGEHEAVPEIFQFSSEMNIVHIVLDAFQADVFAEIVAESEAHYSGLLEGFTFYSDATGHYPTTYVSVPAYMSGNLYRNRLPVREFTRGVMSGETVSNVVFRNGFDTDFIVGPGFYRHGQSTHNHRIPKQYRSKRETIALETAEILDLVLFRSAPQPLKKRIYQDQRWFLQRHATDSASDQFIQFSHLNFLKDYVPRITAERARPVYKLFHLFMSHAPWVIDSDGSFTGEAGKPTWANVKSQQKASLDSVLSLLDRLKQMRVYDSALILMHADHGAGIRKRSSASFNPPTSPLVAVKPPNASGPLQTSSRPVSLADIPDTVFDLLGLPETAGRESMFGQQPPQNTKRVYFSYDWDGDDSDDYFEYLAEYHIEGPLDQRASWSRGKIYDAPARSPLPQNVMADVIERGIGWQLGGKKKNVLWAVGQSASFPISIPATEVLFNVRAADHSSADGKQTVTVSVNGKRVATWRLTDKQVLHTAYVPPDPQRPHTSTVEFQFSHYSGTSSPKKTFAARFSMMELVTPGPL